MTPGVSKIPFRVSLAGGVGDGQRTLVATLLRAAQAGGGTGSGADQVAFSTKRRSFVVVATPTQANLRQLFVGASTADLALILVDAQKGIQVATRRHTFLAALFGIPHIALVVNKMDLAGYSQERFTLIEAQHRALAADLGVASSRSVPVSALAGDNLTTPSGAMPWYRGPTLMGLLEDLEVIVP
jgi:bifunctional enzyme CysN/CysC